VAVLDVDRVQGAKTAARLGRKGRFVPCDVGKPEEVAAAAKALARFGALDGLVNDAGFGGFKPLEGLSVEEWDRILDVNLRGMFLCVQAFLPRLRRGGAVVNVASTRALMSEPDGEAYAASKGGVLALTHALAVSLQPRGLRVNAVAPGWIDVRGWQGKGLAPRLRALDHAQHPVGRVGRPQDVAEAVDFLLDSRRSGFITGQRLVVDGGMTVRMLYAE